MPEWCHLEMDQKENGITEVLWHEMHFSSAHNTVLAAKSHSSKLPSHIVSYSTHAIF